MLAALHALGKMIDGSGLDTCAIESGAYTSAALSGIFGDKAYKRGIEYHIITSLAIMMLQFDAQKAQFVASALLSRTNFINATQRWSKPLGKFNLGMQQISSHSKIKNHWRVRSIPDSVPWPSRKSSPPHQLLSLK